MFTLFASRAGGALWAGFTLRANGAHRAYRTLLSGYTLGVERVRYSSWWTTSGSVRGSRTRCCAGAAATAIETAKNLGADSAHELVYATSYDKSPGDSFVGYVGIVM